LEGSREITANHIKRTLSIVSEASVMPLCDGIGARNPVRVGRSLRRIKSTRKRDPTIAVCRFVWSAAVSKWVTVGSLLHQGVPENEIADALDLSPYYLKRLMPAVKRWGWKDLTDLVWVLAVSERGVYEGHVNPWRALESRLLQVVVGSAVR
jgi:DNA polymerase III delta subunit